MLDRPVDYDSLADTGSAMGSGGIIAMDTDTCLVDLARHFLSFAQDEACGQCVPCRAGNGVMLDILNAISAGHGELADLEQLQNLGKAIQQTSLCGLGQTAPNPILSALRYFRPEFEAHLRGSCPAQACSPNGAATHRISDPTSRHEPLSEPAAHGQRE
jgi:NADH:ubiquinone oxidoreductase subunit F (NADH-binding)